MEPEEPEEPHSREEALATDPDDLMQEIRQCITRLYKMTSLIRRAAPTDPFAKALSRNRYFFNEQYDIAHVGEKFPYLATVEMIWLRERLGRAITQRRCYLSYIQDHRDKLERMLHPGEQALEVSTAEALPVAKLSMIESAQLETASRPSTYFTKATTVVVEQIAPVMLAVDDDFDSEDDAKSYTTISRSVAGDLDVSAAMKVPKLEDLRTGTKKEVECPFCFRIKCFGNERTWRRHVFSDLRTYVCTFADCNSPYFGDINDWFRHEMNHHRVSYACQLCSRKYIETEELYLSHIRQKHPALLLAGDEQTVLSIARNPLEQLNPQDCPCCNDWPDRLRSRTAAEAADLGESSDQVYVTPNVFKRHLASHLEQLALFAVPIPHSSVEEEVRSTIANGDVGTVSNEPSQSSITPVSRSHISTTEPAPVVDPTAINEIGEVLQKLLALVDFGQFANPATLAATRSDDTFSRRLRIRAANLILADADLATLADAYQELMSVPEDEFEQEARRLFQSVAEHQEDDFKKLTARVLFDAYQSLIADGDVPVDHSGLSKKSPPDSPASSYGTAESPTNTTRSVGDLPSVLPHDSLLPPLNVSNNNVEVSPLDPTPYPAFLRPRQPALLNDKWNDLEWAQMNRLRDGMAPTDTEEPARWARCSGEPYAPRNRYMNVDPYQANRIRLQVPEGADDYINASPIELITTNCKVTLRYIATQGPKADTWSHFWRMLWFEAKSPAVIVMLTKTQEQGREKCYPYYPRSTSEPDLRVNEHDEFEDEFATDLRLIKLLHLEETRTEVRELDMVWQLSEEHRVMAVTRRVWHLLFEGWPDFSVPEGSDKSALLELARFAHKKNTSDSPIIVHCSAGIGRTGTFIALDWLMHELQEGSLDDVPNDEDPITRCIESLRDQRPMMVQSKQQFIFIYDALREQWRKRWVELHPEEARVLGITHEGSVPSTEEPALKRVKGNMRSDGPDVSFMSDVERANPEAELMGADYE